MGERGLLLACCGLIVLAAMAVYGNSFSGPFVYDDVESISENSTIRTLWPLSVPLSPPTSGTTVTSRPVLNLTLAVNHALGGTAVWGYHAGNLLIHALAGLALLGVLRRTFARPALREIVGAAALPLACAVAVLWTVHPLQTESVTYVAQRAESLAGLFYLLTLYCFIRGVESAAAWRWFAASVGACLLGVGTKEIAATAPIMVLLYDRTFAAGSFAEAWRRRWRVHAALFATWAPLAWLIASAGSRGGTSGFGTGMSPWGYALTQCYAVPMYLRLAFWPQPQVFDYGYGLITDWAALLPNMLVLAALGALTAWMLWRRPVVGFALCWIFVILAPSSTFFPTATQTMAEHRMYLPLAGVLALAAVGLCRWLGWRRGMGMLAAAAIVFAAFTIQRNTVYRSAEALWRDTVEKWPRNARAQSAEGMAMLDQGRLDEALERNLAAERLDPGRAALHINLGTIFARLGNSRRAVEELNEALRLSPDDKEAHGNLANILMLTGRRDEAFPHFQEALRLDPRNGLTHSNFGILLMAQGKQEEALGHFEKAVEFAPGYAEGHNNLGLTLAKMGRRDEAIAQFREALRLEPSYAQAQANLKRFETGPPATSTQ